MPLSLFDQATAREFGSTWINLSRLWLNFILRCNRRAAIQSTNWKRRKPATILCACARGWQRGRADGNSAQW